MLTLLHLVEDVLVRDLVAQKTHLDVLLVRREEHLFADLFFLHGHRHLVMRQASPYDHPLEAEKVLF